MNFWGVVPAALVGDDDIILGSGVDSSILGDQ